MEKLRRMVETGFSYDGICWPIDMVENHEGVRIGYLMNKARGVELQKSLFIKPLMEKHFGSWTKVDTVRLALTILNKISKLHCNNIVIGDINPLNILVNSPEEVYFVDTDSYQIEDLPCFVGTVFFTAPELQRKNFRTFLRTLGNERFAVATILFMIMLPGKPPYAQQGGEDPVTNIVNMDFSYPFEAKSNKKTPAGPWRFCWSHLPYTIKKAFYETFSHNGQYSKENDRLSVTQWIDLFTTYLKLLKDGTLTQQDPISIDIFPFRFKSTDKSSFEQCTLCKRQFPVGDLQQGQGYCKGCLRETFKIIKCTNCDKDVIVTYDDMIYFDSNNLPVPKNCSSCHNKIKSGKIMNNRNSKQLDTNYNIKIQSDTVHVECIRCGDDMIVNKKEKRKLHLCVSCKDKKPLKRYDVVFKQ
jgi:serine/threonine protein kinase